MRKNRLLLIEDDDNSAKLLLDLLENRDFAIDHVRDGVTAVARVEAAAYDIVILDLRLPGQNGFITAEKIRQTPNGQRTPIIVTTAFADPQYKLRAYQSGANIVLSKPLNIRELLYIVTNQLRLKEPSRIAEEAPAAAAL